MKISLKGGQDFYWISTKNRQEELDRRGGILLKTAGETRGNPGEAGTGLIIYHREQKVLEQSFYIGNHITKSAAEYISIIIALKLLRRTFRCVRNKIIIINIKSDLVVNQIRNVWRIRNPKLYLLHNIIMAQLQNLNYYIEHIP